MQMRHIFNTSKVHHQVLKKAGTTQRCFLNESLLSLGVSIKNIYSLQKAAKANQFKMLKKILVPNSCYIEI